MNSIRVELPFHLRNLAGVEREITLQLEPPVTLHTLLDELEKRHPTLKGTIREHQTQKRRPLIRFFACQEDISHTSPQDPLPEAIVNGNEPLIIIGAVAGG